MKLLEDQKTQNRAKDAEIGVLKKKVSELETSTKGLEFEVFNKDNEVQ